MKWPLALLRDEQCLVTHPRRRCCCCGGDSGGGSTAACTMRNMQHMQPHSHTHAAAQPAAAALAAAVRCCCCCCRASCALKKAHACSYTKPGQGWSVSWPTPSIPHTCTVGEPGRRAHSSEQDIRPPACAVHGEASLGLQPAVVARRRAASLDDRNSTPSTWIGLLFVRPHRNNTKITQSWQIKGCGGGGGGRLVKEVYGAGVRGCRRITNVSQMGPPHLSNVTNGSFFPCSFRNGTGGDPLHAPWAAQSRPTPPRASTAALMRSERA